MSPYAYVNNNPLMFTDPTGMKGESIHEDEDGNVITQYDDGDRGVYQHANGTSIANIDAQRQGGNTGGDGNYLGEMEDVLDHSTVGKNILGGNYPGPDNPQNYPAEDGSRKASYTEAPVDLAGIPAIIHDMAYDKLGIKGKDGLTKDARASSADFTFVKNELRVAAYSIATGDYKTGLKAIGLAIGVGALATPKTVKTAPKGFQMIKSFPIPNMRR